MDYKTLASALMDATSTNAMAGAGGSEYLRLLRGFPLMPISDSDHLAAALAVLDQLYSQEQPSDEARAYRGVLVTLVAEYERRHPALLPVRGVALLRHLIAGSARRVCSLAGRL